MGCPIRKTNRTEAIHRKDLDARKEAVLVGSKLMIVLFLFKEMKPCPSVHSNKVIPSISGMVDAGVKRRIDESFMLNHSTAERGKDHLVIKVAGIPLLVLRTILFNSPLFVPNSGNSQAGTVEYYYTLTVCILKVC